MCISINCFESQMQKKKLFLLIDEMGHNYILLDEMGLDEVGLEAMGRHVNDYCSHR